MKICQYLCAEKEFLLLHKQYTFRVYYFASLLIYYESSSNHSRRQNKTKTKAYALVFVILCAEKDSNLRRINPGGLQPPAIDRSATDAFVFKLWFEQMWMSAHLASIRIRS